MLSAKGLASGLVAVDHRDPRPFLQEPLDSRCADAAGATRDQDSLAGQTFHRCS
jgi:hypothetical protein